VATPLPPPATVEEMYLAAILAELQGIRSNAQPVGDSSQDDGGEIDLKEPKQTTKTKTKK